MPVPGGGGEDTRHGGQPGQAGEGEGRAEGGHHLTVHRHRQGGGCRAQPGRC